MTRRIHEWFSLSRASWLTLPRVLLQEMDDEWQEKFVELLEQFNEKFPKMEPASTTVTATKHGRMIPMPEGAGNYRRPDLDYIERCKGNE